MTVFSGKQVFPVDYEAEVSQRLLEASLSGDLKSALDCIDDPFVDVNFIGAVWLKTRETEVVLCDESASEVRVYYEEFKADVTALFLAVHAGNVVLVKKLLSAGADVNEKPFRGFATTAAVREGHIEILGILLKAGASQPACEEALLEASRHGRARFAELLIASDLIRPHVAMHALVTACCRGFDDLVDTLIKSGADANTSVRMLLQSTKPSLHTNVDCTALVAAVVSRQVSIVRLLLQVGARTDIKVNLGAWSWDTATGEEFRVGAGLAEPYPVTWCAVEYFESSGAILQMLLQQVPSHTRHGGRTLLHHAILCGNLGAINVLLHHGANVESPIETTGMAMFRSIHMASRLGLSKILQFLIDSGCYINSKIDTGETALMICAIYKQEVCLKVLATNGADFGLINVSGQSVSSIAQSNKWCIGFELAVLDVLRDGKVPRSSNLSVFSPLLFAAQAGDSEALKAVVDSREFDVNYQDDKGFSAVMITALNSHVEAFRLLVYAGADVKLCNKSGDNAISLSQSNQNSDLFEKVMLEFALEKGYGNAGGGFCALHCASRRGDVDAVKLLTSRGYYVNVPDGDSYTPLMLAAREGHGTICKLLISHGANIDEKNAKGESALSLACKKGLRNEAEQVILDELARRLVTNGDHVKKHTKGGKGRPHRKEMRMIVGMGVLLWGKSRKRNVICREAEVGPSQTFCRNRQRMSDLDEPGLFRVVTTKNKEVHFVCEGGLEMAMLWVRGIKLVTSGAGFGNGKII